MKSEFKHVKRYSLNKIKRQWDAIAKQRDAQLRSGVDLSFEHILKPTILALIESADRNEVLDAGCGSGVLTEFLAALSNNVTAVDLSSENIEIALKSSQRLENISYVNSSLEDYLESSKKKFSLVVANMVLQDINDLGVFLSAVASACQKDSNLVATITHPYFWPLYWGYEKEKWFQYNKKLAVEAPFKISNAPGSIGKTTHFHRPLASYVRELSKAGFVITSISEPLPSDAMQSQYPNVWKFPRFLAFNCSFRG